jgi:hypothetical protein
MLVKNIHLIFQYYYIIIILYLVSEIYIIKFRTDSFHFIMNVNLL